MLADQCLPKGEDENLRNQDNASVRHNYYAICSHSLMSLLCVCSWKHTHTRNSHKYSRGCIQNVTLCLHYLKGNKLHVVSVIKLCI